MTVPDSGAEGPPLGLHPVHYVRRGPAIHTGRSVVHPHRPTPGPLPDPDNEPADRRERLEGALPLFLAGAVCLAISGVLFADRGAGFIARFEPWILFLALGVTGVVGGLVSVVVDADDQAESKTYRRFSSEVPASRRAFSLPSVHRSPDFHPEPVPVLPTSGAMPATPPSTAPVAARASEEQGKRASPRPASPTREAKPTDNARDGPEVGEIPLEGMPDEDTSESPFSSDEAIDELDRIMAELGPYPSGKVARHRQSPG